MSGGLLRGTRVLVKAREGNLAQMLGQGRKDAPEHDKLGY